MKRPKIQTSKRANREQRRIDALCAWFVRCARDLPWRKPKYRTGYGALVAEAMLQQTQVARVIERYRAFMRKFPSVRKLAAAQEQDVLAMWNGLGYYRRAGNLHAAARGVIKEFRGRVPQTATELRVLPGVGPYTAGAIASIVFGAPEPIVDGNVRRVLSRWFGKRMATPEWTWNKAAKVVDLAPNPGVFNEALMELGATVCTPRTPRCDSCPVAQYCCAREHGAQDRIPSAEKRANPRVLHHHAVVVFRRNGREILLEQRPDQGMWARMWQVPTIESHRALALIEVKTTMRLPLHDLVKTGSFEHRTTHRRIIVHAYQGKTWLRRGIWRPRTAIENLPMSNAQRRVCKSCMDNQLRTKPDHN